MTGLRGYSPSATFGYVGAARPVFAQHDGCAFGLGPVRRVEVMELGGGFEREVGKDRARSGGHLGEVVGVALATEPVEDRPVERS
jgi:hypothetical protein